MNITHNLIENISPGKSKSTIKKFLTEFPRRRRIEGAARVGKGVEVHHRGN